MSVLRVLFVMLSLVLFAGDARAQCELVCPSSPPAVRGCVGDYSVCGRWVAIPDCPSPAGEWRVPPWPNCWPNAVEAIHAILTHTGRILVFRNTVPDNNCIWNSNALAFFWDPGEFNTSDPVNDIMMYSSDTVDLHDNLFCSGHIASPDGKILLFGGTDMSQSGESGAWGNTTLFEFDPNGTKTQDTMVDCGGVPTSTSWWRMDWFELASMQHRRWYPTPTLLPDNRILATAGTGVPGNLSEIPEIYNRTLNSWTSLTNAPNDQPPAGDMHIYFPFMYLLPGPGAYVLHAGPQRTALNQVQTFGNLESVGTASWVDYGLSGIEGGTAVTYDKGRVLKTGGPGTAEFGDPTVPNAEIININMDGTLNFITSAAPMTDSRLEHDLTVLADGTVFVSGGAKTAGDPTVCCEDGIFDSEFWTPPANPQDPNDGGSWTSVAPMTHRTPWVPRIYHSTTLLLPDGRVLSAGGECFVEQTDCQIPSSKIFDFYTNADFFEPPYLYKAGNVPITSVDRPQATAPPAFVSYSEGMQFSVTFGVAASSLSKIAFVRPGSVTHSTNFDQRYVPLDFSVQNNVLTVASADMPNSRLLPPGYYMLFLINDQNRPSKADFVNVWGIIDTSVQESVSVTCSGTTFDILWDTTVPTTSASLEIFAPGVNCETAAPTASSSESSTGTQHQVDVFTAICSVGDWHYHVESTNGTSISTTGCQTYTVASCPSCGGGPCSKGCDLN